MTSASLSLRPPQPHDYDAIASWVTDARACIRWAGPGLAFPFPVPDLAILLSISGGQSYCLASGPATAIGFGQFWIVTPGSVHLGRIILSPMARGKGAGRVLCRALIAKAVHETAAEAVTLRVYRDNTSAVALYSSLGFTPDASGSTAEVIFMKAAAHPAV